MSRFDNPQYMAESKAGLRQYLETGHPPPGFFTPDPASVSPAMRLNFHDWELRALRDALLQAGPRGNYYKLLPRDFPRTQTCVLTKVAITGGRQAFLDKYGDL